MQGLVQLPYVVLRTLAFILMNIRMSEQAIDRTMVFVVATEVGFPPDTCDAQKADNNAKSLIATMADRDGGGRGTVDGVRAARGIS